ncbi:ABC-type Na+ efflux pump, permease component [Aequorivita sublithincola DSM 14238]|uniref:ABC-type Na+ efflux pump, permease component n=1 Tax=Aequorivita sublithincola (strain DSM 14238 / LMG 21431 / ACAM 643 / 9-3) TaxID=746697 RepID=I3YSA7_AEQSU|nr:ABC transporter permease [Aequorivita sublithincola]AFL79875.1 ABC-type Na+ efflux pump, permease component [Aequorivita sublithincola DSM 14238]
MNHLPLIIKREYLTKVRNKSFIIMTFLTPFIFAGIFALVAYLSSLNSDTVRAISVMDESGLFADQFKSSPHTQYKMLQNVSLDEAKKEAETNEFYGLLYIPKTENLEDLSKKITFYSEDSPSLSMMSDINRMLESRVNTLKLKEAGIDSETIKNLHINISANQETFKGKETSKLGSGLKLVFGAAAGYLLFMFIIIYGNMIMRSVIEEKTSRVIEVIISSVKPRVLLLGKIFGTTLAGISQVLVWIVLILVLMTTVTTIFGIDPAAASPSQQVIENSIDGGTQQLLQDVMLEINNLPIANLIIMFILFFVGGYLLYASLYASVGAAVDSETDTQQFMMPILTPLILAVYVGFFTVMDNPHGTVSQVFSYIPFTSPVVMLMRIPFGVPIWQQIVSVVILFGTFIGMVWFAAKIYRVGILMYGKKPTYKEIFKWLKY